MLLLLLLLLINVVYKEMRNLTNTSHTTFSNAKSKRKIRGATMMAKVSKSNESGVYFPVYFCPITGKAYGEHADSFRSYALVNDRIQVVILIDNWHEVSDELKY